MKILIVGLGSIGQRHLRNLRQVYGDRIAISAYRSVGRNLIIHDNMTAETGDVGKHYGIKIFTDYSEALEQNPDAVFITCPTSLHIPMALEAARHNCHLFIEKPLSDTMEGVEDLIKIVKEKNLVALVGYQMRFHPGLRLIHELIEEGRIGQVLSAHCEFGEYLPHAHPYEDYREGYAARQDLGGGVLLCLSHELDYTQWLFGMPRKVFCLGGKLSNLEIDVIDMADILMKYNKTIPVHIHLDFIQQPPSRTCSIIGERGKIFWNCYYNCVNLYTTKGGWEVCSFDKFEPNHMFLDEMQNFLLCLRGKDQPKVNLYDAIDTLRIALAAKQSMKTGEFVEVT